MQIEIKPASIDNAKSIALLSAQLGYPSSVEQTEQRLNAVISSDNDVAFIAFREEDLAGWIHVFYTIRIESDPFCEIAGLVVDENFRGKGIGKQLVAEAKKWCSGKNCNDLRVRSNVVRDDAHAFYERAGFRLKKEQRVFEIKL